MPESVYDVMIQPANRTPASMIGAILIALLLAALILFGINECGRARVVAGHGNLERILAGASK